MTPEELIKYYHEGITDRGGCGGPVMFAMALLLFLLCSCKQIEYVPVEKVVKEYVVKTDTFIKKDSILLKDSVSIHAKNDTVWYEKWHTKYVDRWNERLVYRDSVRCDSIPVPYEVPAKLSRWERLKVDWGGYAMLAVLAGLVVLIFRIKGKFGL